MDAARRRLRRSAPALAAWTFVAAACAAPAPEPTLQVEAPAEVIVPQEMQVDRYSLPDITARPLPSEALAEMLPTDAVVSTRSNEQLVLDAVLDREDQADDVVAHRRSTGIAGEYERADGSAHVWIDVLEDPAAAHDYLVDLSGDIAKGVDGTHRPGAAVTSVSEFAVDVGEESIGLMGTLGDGSVETMILTRVGRLVLFSSEIRSEDTDTRVAVQYLVEDAIEQVLEWLTGTAVDLSPRLTPSYRFLTTVDVSSSSVTWTIGANGTVDGTDRQCTLERSTPLSATTTDVIALGEVRWLRVGDTSRYSAVGANAEAAATLAWCPMWPLELTAAVLDGVAPAADPPRHHVNGVDAMGYQGTLNDLADATGIDAAATTLESFSFWVADGTDYVVELSLIVEGPSDALRPLIGSEFDGLDDVTVSIRHRVFDLGATDPIIAPS